MSDSNNHDAEPPTLTILYATETGTAQDAAAQIARRVKHAGFSVRVHDVADYASEDILDETHIAFVVATAGNGNEPRSLTPLWSLLLRADLPADLLDDARYAVFGLGDSAYARFCWPAKRLDRRLSALGAAPLCARGEGDVQAELGTEGALDPWIEALLESLRALHPAPAEEPVPELWPARATLTPATREDLESAADPMRDAPGYHALTLAANTRITAEDWTQDVRHFAFSSESDLEYEPGDVAVVHPEASADDVASVLRSQDWEAIADDPLRIEHVHIDQPLPPFLPRTTTLRAILTRHVDVAAVPRRAFFAAVRNFTSDAREREKMDEFVTTKEGAEDMYEYATRVRRTIAEVLDEFRHVRIPLTHVLDVFPPLRPREFSIASAAALDPRALELCVAIVGFRTKLRRPRTGVATAYLARLAPGATLRVGLKKGLLALPPDPATPVICVGPGTGIAPVRAVIQTRIHGGSSNNTLYFGCRHADKDQHYAAEWAEHAAAQSLAYRAAFSRDGPEGEKRPYVQDLLAADAKRVWEAIGAREGWVYISGASNKMPAAVRAALARAAEVGGGMDGAAAVAYVDAMEREGRLFEECWG